MEEKAHAQTEAQKKKDESEIVSHTAINATKQHMYTNKLRSK